MRRRGLPNDATDMLEYFKYIRCDGAKLNLASWLEGGWYCDDFFYDLCHMAVMMIPKHFIKQVYRV